MSVHCDYFAAGECRSCSDIETPYAAQLENKQARLKVALSDWPELHWLDPVASSTSGFRSKAKMAVGGSIDAPTLGIADAAGRAVDLPRCLLYPTALSAAFEPIKRFISAANISPYDIVARRGELKFVLLTLAEDSGELMLRFVLRSREALGRIQRHLPELLDAVPSLTVVSANLQPLPAAIVEGDEEIPLTPNQQLAITINGLRMQLQPRAFFQTNTRMAAALYRQAARWVNAIAPAVVWDLYCGVGGFALHCAAPGREVIGIERSHQAVAAARLAAVENFDANVAAIRFEAADADGASFPALGGPELLIVNPPRRGLGAALCAEIERASLPWLIYSSCNPRTLADDLRRLPDYAPREAQLIDIFPHTAHAETLILLQRKMHTATS